MRQLPSRRQRGKDSQIGAPQLGSWAGIPGTGPNCGAEGQSRTDTGLPPPVFETGASTIPPLRHRYDSRPFVSRQPGSCRSVANPRSQEARNLLPIWSPLPPSGRAARRSTRQELTRITYPQFLVHASWTQRLFRAPATHRISNPLDGFPFTPIRSRLAARWRMGLSRAVSARARPAEPAGLRVPLCSQCPCRFARHPSAFCVRNSCRAKSQPGCAARAAGRRRSSGGRDS